MSGALRVLVLEDEWIARNFLVELIEASGHGTVVGAVPSIEHANELLSGADGIDVTFVDINLAGSEATGLSLVRQWAGRPSAPMFVLATAMKEHALEAFELGVVDYITKPFSLERVTQCLQRLQHKSALRTLEPPKKIVARRKKSLVFLAIDDIWAFEASDRLTLVHSVHGSFDIDLSLSTIETSFGKRFLRAHRNWLVNEAHIRELERDSGESTLLVGLGHSEQELGIRVPVARDRAQAIRDQLLAAAPGVRQR